MFFLSSSSATISGPATQFPARSFGETWHGSLIMIERLFVDMITYRTHLQPTYLAPRPVPQLSPVLLLDFSRYSLSFTIYCSKFNTCHIFADTPGTVYPSPKDDQRCNSPSSFPYIPCMPCNSRNCVHTVLCRNHCTR
jgi:hypothetical protein